MTATASYEFLICLLIAILVLELAARWLGLPPAAAFIVGGIVLALIPGVPGLAIDPDLVLVVFLPPLLMSGAFFTVWREFRRNLGGILLLAMGAVAFTTATVGLAAKAMVPGLPWAVCFALGAILPVVAVVVLVVVASRFAWLFGSDVLRRCARRLGRDDVVEPSFAVATVLGCSGMRGVLTLAAALSLPTGLPGRDLVLACAFATILFTVLIQGTTLGPLIGLLRIAGKEELEQHRDSADVAWRNMTRVQYETVAALSRRPDGGEKHPRMLEQYGFRARVAAEYTEGCEAHDPIKLDHFGTVLAAVEAGRADTLRMHRAGEIHDRVLHDLEYELDLQQMVAESHL